MTSHTRYESGTDSGVTALNRENRMSPARQRKSASTNTVRVTTDQEVALQGGDEQSNGAASMDTTSDRPGGGTDALDADSRIRRRAYEIYLSRDGQPGTDLDDWLAAEREVGRQG
jgi:hypothetical protein